MRAGKRNARRQPVNVPTGEVPPVLALQERLRKAVDFTGYDVDPARRPDVAWARKEYRLRQVAAQDVGDGPVVVARVMVNVQATPLDAALASGAISPRQHEAGLQVHRYWRQQGLAGRQRDSLDISPRGKAGNVADGGAAASAHAMRELAKLRDRLRMMSRGGLRDECYAIGMSVCAHLEPTGDRRQKYRRFALLCHFLDAAADLWGIAGPSKTPT
jgi:hypothetical protein